MTVTFQVGDDAVGVVTLNRPDKLNAMSYEVFTGLHDAAAQAAEAARDSACRAVLVTGAGRAFSAGLDVALFGEQASGAAPDDERIAWLQQAFTGFEDLPVPTVAAIRGVALGAGCQLALACHLRIAAPDASLGLLEARWGLIPDLGATWRLPRLVGLGRATDLAVTARRIDAATALAWGLVDAVAEAEDDFDGWAHRYVAALAAAPTVAVGAVPQLLRNSYAGDRDTVLAAERRAQQRCLASQDFIEAATAALQQRQPQFRGR
ncbi:MAG TPA: enoyl-CoA hydratase/isomerase family protein [Egibacteraceae bacterium]|nr:enoyl-CoA hydratase/isomerase family protein [Egibacteraceae bacterium]